MNCDVFQKYSVDVSDSQQSQHSVNSKQSIEIILQNISPAKQIPLKKYSLEADMITGWKPKTRIYDSNKFVVPIAIVNPLLDKIIDSILNKKMPMLKIVYMGSRWNDSYQMHQSLSNIDISHKIPYKTKFQLNSDRNNNNETLKIKSLQFTSDIQCGNLDLAIRKSETQYDLFMRVDTNTKGHTSWYNFIVKNNSFIGKIKFNIMNFRKKRSLYQRKMKPFIKSFKYQNQWKQQGQVHSYKQSKQTFYEIPNFRPNFKIQQNYILSFSYQFKHENDEIQIAYSIPYSLSRLNRLIESIQQKPYVKISCLTKSLGQNKIPLIQITQQNQQKKKVIVISARVHPGQTNGSFVAEGLIKALCQQDILTKKIRKQFHFKIVPMLNPDGVMAGNYRTGLLGVDLNRVYDKDKIYFPQVKALKNLIKSQAKRIKHPIDYFIDLHGHSIKKNIFLYGPQHQLNSNKYNNCRLLAKHLSNLSTMFRYYSCTWRIASKKQTTARAVFFRKLNISNCYTLQSSNGLYFDRVSNSQKYFNEQSWISMGSILIKGIYQSAQQIQRQNQQSKSIRARRQNRKLQQQMSTSIKLEENLIKCSDDQISESDSDSQPQDNIQFNELDWTKNHALFDQKRQVSSKKSKCKNISSMSHKKYMNQLPVQSINTIQATQSIQHIQSIASKAKTSLAYNEQQKKLPIIIHKSNKSQSLKIKRVIKQSSPLIFQKPITSRVNMSDMVQKKIYSRQQQMGFATILNRMVLNLNYQKLQKSNNTSVKSIKESPQKKQARYINNKSLPIKQQRPTPVRFIQNLRFQ